jgi:hypothetical protein
MKRRDFLKSMTAVTAGAGLPAAPAVWSPARAQARQETLLIVSESGPNNLDVHGVGTNVPAYEVSWNCYDRLISHEMKTDENGTPNYDRDGFKPELADDMKIGDMSVTFTLKKNAVFQGGTPITAIRRACCSSHSRRMALSAQGLDATKIAKALGIGRASIYRVQEAGVDGRAEPGDDRTARTDHAISRMSVRSA